jgi:hypothetical protein
MTKEIKIQFAPGCFDNFEGSQEELDGLIAEIQQMFEGKTPEEIEAMSNRINPDDLSEEELAQLAEAMLDEEELDELEQMGMPRKRKLQ